MTNQSPQPVRHSTGFTLLVALWIVVGVVLHPIVESLTGISFVADVAVFAYAVVVLILFFAMRRRWRNKNL